MHFGCSKQAIMKRLALNPLLKEMQIKGMIEHCMDDRSPDPLVGESCLSLAELGVVQYSDRNPEGYWTIGDILNLWQSVVTFRLKRFNPRRMMRGAEAAEFEVYKDDKLVDLLWMSKRDIQLNIEEFGESSELDKGLLEYQRCEGN